MPSERDIILEPIISEKTVRLKEENKYVFKVDSVSYTHLTLPTTPYV